MVSVAAPLATEAGPVRNPAVSEILGDSKIESASVLDCAALLFSTTGGPRNSLKDRRWLARPAVFARSATPYNTVPAISSSANRASEHSRLEAQHRVCARGNDLGVRDIDREASRSRP